MKKVQFFFKKHSSWWPWLGLFLLVCIWFYPMFVGKTVLFGDNFSLTGPTKIFAAQWIRQGIIPLWNPYAFSGISFVGDINQSLFYPSTLFFILFNPSTALNLTLFLHVLLGLFGMYALGKKFNYESWNSVLIAGLWGFSNLVGGALNNIATLQSLVLTPWVLYCAIKVGRNEKFAVLLMSFVVTLQLLGGYPQHVLFSLLISVFLILSDRWLEIRRSNKLLASIIFSLFSSVLIAMLLSSFVWMPFLEVLKASTRSVQSVEQASVGSMYPLELIKFISPFVFDSQQLGYRWGPLWNLQPTPIPFLSWIFFIFLFATISNKRWKAVDSFYTFFIVAGLLFAVGHHFPFYRFVRLIPILGSSRGPSTVLSIVLVALTLWFGSLIQRETLKSKSIRNWIVALVVVAGFSLIGLLISTVHFDQFWKMTDGVLSGRLSNSSFHTLERDQILLFGNAVSVLFISLSSIFTLLAWLKHKRVLFVALILFQVLIVSRDRFFFGPKNVYDLPMSNDFVTEFLSSKDQRNFRILTKSYNSPYADFGFYQEALYVRQPFSDSFIDESELSHYSRLNELKNGIPPNWNSTQRFSALHGYTTLVPWDYYQLMATTSARQLKDPGSNGLPYLNLPTDITRSWSVKYYVVDTRLPVIEDDFSALSLVAQQGIYQIYELPNVLARFRYDNEQPVELTRYSENPNVIYFESFNANRQTYLIVADRYDSNWRVTVNGSEIPLENWQGMRRFTVPEGPIAVKMWFHPIWFYRGLLISGLTLLGILLFGGVKLWRLRKASS